MQEAAILIPAPKHEIALLIGYRAPLLGEPTRPHHGSLPRSAHNQKTDMIISDTCKSGRIKGIDRMLCCIFHENDFSSFRDR